MNWLWQLPDWPQFRYRSSDLAAMEDRFLREAGYFSGSIAHIGKDDKDRLAVRIMSEEAQQTSEIEGEQLDRDSLQSSIRRHFGLGTDQRRIPPAEEGMAGMMVELYRNHAGRLNRERLCHWHTLLTQGRRDLADAGGYRTGSDPMQIVSGPIHKPEVHYEAPPAAAVPGEMDAFLEWFARTAPGGSHPLPMLTRAGLAHLYFVAIHPFEDGNGRIARAIAEKALAEDLGHPLLLPLSQTINAARKDYYFQLGQTNHSLEVTPWLLYFARTVLDAQGRAQQLVGFLLAKARFFDTHRGAFNARQRKALLRMFDEGPGGFVGGLSAEKYIRITGTTRPTATRDLHDLVEKQALERTGRLKGTRYHLALGSNEDW